VGGSPNWTPALAKQDRLLRSKLKSATTPCGLEVHTVDSACWSISHQFSFVLRRVKEHSMSHSKLIEERSVAGKLRRFLPYVTYHAKLNQRNKGCNWSRSGLSALNWL
jgi:hypothetical protein